MVRRRKETIEKRIVHGSVAIWQGPNAEPGKSHRWTVYLRSADDPAEDLSPVVSRVEFLLHETFESPVRQVIEPPFEVTEYGWGEFEVVLRVHFADSTERSVDLYHPLRLFPPPGMEQSEQPVVSEHVDVLMFVEPTEKMYRALMEHAASGPRAMARPSVVAPHMGGELREVEEEDRKRVMEARAQVRQQMAELQKRYEQAVQAEEMLRSRLLARSKPGGTA